VSELRIGPIEGFVMHFGEHANGWLCMKDHTPMAVRKIHTWTTDRAKVDCPPCVEWLHA